MTLAKLQRKFLRQLLALLVASILTLGQSRKDTSMSSVFGKNGGLSMSTSFQDQASELLSGDLIPFLSDRSVPVILARITNIEKRSGADQTEAGIVTLRVLRVLRGGRLKNGDLIAVSFGGRFVDPLVRVRNRFNQWNQLSLTPGDLLLMAVKPGAADHNYIGMAAVQVQSADDPQVPAAQQICGIEDEQRSEPKEHLLSQALFSNQPMLRFYALEAISRKNVIKRDRGARMIEDAILSSGLSAEAKQDLGSKLITGGFFDESQGADSVNAGIIAVLAKQTVESRDPEIAEQWMELLSSALGNEFSPAPHEDREIKVRLVRSVNNPTADQVISFLATQVASTATADGREIAKKLLNLWKSAGQKHS
jgi:hypothetical protein